MSVSRDGVRPVEASVAWYVPILRAIPALVLGAIITFTAEHSAGLGLLALGIYGVAAGIILLVASWRGVRQGAVSVRRAQAIVTVAVGVAALVRTGGGLPYLILLIAVFAVITGFLELYLGIRGRRRDAAAKDALFAGGLTVLLALAVLVVPPDLVQSFTGPDGVGRQLTASVIVVGVLGAYWIVLGVYLVIAGLSLKWVAEPTPSDVVASTKIGD